MANSEVDIHFNNDGGADFRERMRLNREQMRLNRDKLIFDARFWRCYRTLHFIACRVLGGPKRAEEAIELAWRTASRHPQRFEHEGEFRGWLLRILIDEALTLLRESVPTPTPKVFFEPAPAPVFRVNDIRDGKSDIRTDDQDRLSQDFSVALE
jgi:DNA-directed RNA polymerase specialized sigma24 family protein